MKLLFYYSNDGFVLGHQQHWGLAPALPWVQQQLKPEHAPQPGEGHGLLLLRGITLNLWRHNQLINIHQSPVFPDRISRSITQPCQRKCNQEQIAKLKSVKSDRKLSHCTCFCVPSLLTASNWKQFAYIKGFQNIFFCTFSQIYIFLFPHFACISKYQISTF